MASPDTDWIDAHQDLLPHIVEQWEDLIRLHIEKSATYGTDEDALANFTVTAELAEMCWEAPASLRICDKLVRAVNMVKDGCEDDVAEWPDIASLALCCEALRRRRNPELDN